MAARARDSRPDDDDYSDLATLPKPNMVKFGPNGGPDGEMSVPPNIQHQILSFIVEQDAGRTLSSTPLGILYEALSADQKREKALEEEEEEEDDGIYGGIPAGCYAPRISVEAEVQGQLKKSKTFTCEGTMYRHTAVHWRDAPVEFQRPHEAEAQAFVYRQKIEDLTPFDCDVYWKTIWEKCPACHKADQEFKRWAMRASTPGGKAALADAASRKRKASEKTSSEEADQAQGKPKAQKGNLKGELKSEE